MISGARLLAVRHRRRTALRAHEPLAGEPVSTLLSRHPKYGAPTRAGRAARLSTSGPRRRLRRASLVWLVLIAIVLQLAPAAIGVTSAAAAPTPVKIMPLGDSITHGLAANHYCCGVPGAYRINLDPTLRNAGYAFDFVGSQSNGPQQDKHHEGRPGYRIDEIHNGKPGVNTGVNQWLPARTPDVVLLLIGTNDILQNRDVPNAPARLSALVDRIFALRPAAKVYLASIPPLVGPKAHLNSKVVTYNDGVEAVVAAKLAAGKQIQFVDVYSAFGAGDLGSDGVHPTRAGHDKIAAVWGDALLGSQPVDTTEPTVTSRSPLSGATGVATSANVTATFSEPLNPTTVTSTNVTLTGGSSAVAASVTYDNPTRTVTLDPSAALQPGITYTAFLNGGTGGIADAANNVLADDVTWTFTTAESQPPPAGWAHVGTGLLASVTTASTNVAYPSGIAAGDLLLLGCQGRNNNMNWSASGFGTLVAPTGPSGLRFELLSKWATGGESGSLAVSNATGLNGWSCSITAMRGGIGSGDPVAATPSSQFATTRTMVAPGAATVPAGALVTRWYASSDDNAHGSPSDGVLAYGGTAYHTTTGVHHGASMSYAVQYSAGSRGLATMVQDVNYSDPSVGVTVVLQPGP
jgi:lysophospholipase L1-like esterase